jgi:hypothetical protein
MSAVIRAICSVVLVFSVLGPAWGYDWPTPPPKPVAPMPIAKPLLEKANPPTKTLPPQENIEKRRERMKQRDGEIDRLLKGKQHRER